MKATFRITCCALIAPMLSLGGRSFAADGPIVAAAGSSQEKAAEKNPLSALPSAPGAHIEKLKALGDNQWLNLGSPAPDPKWGKGYGRSWCPHMPYAPELKAAFLAGEGVHEFVKRDGRSLNDLFVYDMNANRWVCLYPGGDVKNIVLKLDANGFEVDSDGQPIPLAMLGHAYEQSVYDPDRRKFMYMPTISSGHIHVWDERRKTWGMAGKFSPDTPYSPWMYDVASGKFELLKVKGMVPDYSYSNICEYIPRLKKMVYIQTKGIASLYDPQTNTWTSLKPSGPRAPFGIDASACLDLKRERIYFGGGYYDVAPPGTNAFWCYDVKTNAWMDLQPKGKPCGGSNRFGPDTTIMNYDSANDVVVMFNHNCGEEGSSGYRGIFIYDPNTNAWSDMPLPKDIKGHANSFYCPDLNVHFIHTAGDSTDNGTMWVYRYKQTKK
jgi:hypothetical protein